MHWAAGGGENAVASALCKPVDREGRLVANDGRPPGSVQLGIVAEFFDDTGAQAYVDDALPPGDRAQSRARYSMSAPPRAFSVSATRCS